MTRFFRSGSFGYGTSVSGYSDVDYFAVIPTNRLKQDSNASLTEIAAALRQRFPLTNVTIESPAVIVPFGTSRWERHEIIPANYLCTNQKLDFYEIPDRAGSWMQACPDGHAAYVNSIDAKLGNRVKSLIRLVKAWKYYCQVPIRSFYIEIRVAQYAATQQAILLKWDVRGALSHLASDGLANISDPLGLGEIYAAFAGFEIQGALTKLQFALASARSAIAEDQAGNVQAAFGHWDKVFNGNFPGFY